MLVSDYQFATIDKSKTGVLYENGLFEKNVAEKFPSAKDGISAAGNCLALELNNAAVYHLMRVLEFGLRGLAKELKAKTGLKMGI